MKPLPAKGKKGQKAPMDPAKRKRLQQAIIIGSSLLLLLILGTYMLWPESQVDRVRRMQQDLFANRDGLSDEERRQRFEELRAEEDKLTGEQRGELRKAMFKEFQKKNDARGAAYFAMSPEQRQEEINKQLARDIERAKNPRGKGGWGGGGGPGGGGGGPGGGKGGGPGGGGPGGPGGGGSGGKNASPEQRDDFTRNMLINGTPQARAGHDQMRLDMAAARSAAGLPTQGGPGFGGGGPGGGKGGGGRRGP